MDGADSRPKQRAALNWLGRTLAVAELGRLYRFRVARDGGGVSGKEAAANSVGPEVSASAGSGPEATLQPLLLGGAVFSAAWLLR